MSPFFGQPTAHLHVVVRVFVLNAPLPCCLSQAADFGPKTALKLVDRIRGGIKSGQVKTADDTRKALKVGVF